MFEQDIDTSLKVIVVGNGMVGKTSMITRFAKGVFTGDYKKTLAVDFLEKQMYLPKAGEDVTFLLWDTAGQEEYDAITRAYYKGAGAAVIAFSTTDRASFDAIENWYKKVTDECGTIVLALVQNKIDLLDQAAMTEEEVENIARKLNIALWKTCVKEDENVSQLFEWLGEEFVARGGEANLQARAVAPIQEMSTSPVGAKGSPTKGAKSSGGGEGEESGSPAPREGGGAISLHKKPATRRTGGKKSKLPFNCSVL
uniref:Uncharacterized protein n=1 Tax=Chromera velia CCMP2878 TaxID=1169474 RepID=A0A0G4H648_9ALVE|mmetsp:Transcript_20355/g.40752  ORF Transcript_20355/g.40752 Transcript_20355/m.40752 type:complete len:255 (+) Transcript_20355:335-1099(+)|eukprot:Cvel_24844.t1-p1 / transcript=Cvel_24844.t1 / gene=Cvel_24844 / organism=Chromera_velia_CCMP2878 / gene_product=Ras-related protein Rab-23, putative / transcript_product=Ras-related protein Rab-23, putative / location=Cvel_scaffold2741:15374-18729(-) / protein_length=254 / sequence_SO=supercontig / SO=protein_coding / is_pseudo=false